MYKKLFTTITIFFYYVLSKQISNLYEHIVLNYGF